MSSLLNHLGGQYLSEVFRPGSQVGSTRESTASVNCAGQPWLLRDIPSSRGSHCSEGTRSKIGAGVATWSEKACLKAAVLGESVHPWSRYRSGLCKLSVKTFTGISAVGNEYAQVN